VHHADRWERTPANLALAAFLIGFVVQLGTIVLGLVVLYVAVRWAGTRERAFMRDIIAPEVAAGTITGAELDALAGQRKERRRALKAGGRRREKHVLEAARDLASGEGEDTPDVMHWRAEIARLRG
jgi:protease PrsW